MHSWMPQHSDCAPTVPIKAYRALHGLPTSFGIAHFEPKDYTDLARIDHAAAGAALNDLRRLTLAQAQAFADKRPQVSAWVSAVDDLARMFAKELERINAVVGLRPNELDFAISGFYDVCKAWSFALLRPVPRKTCAWPARCTRTNMAAPCGRYRSSAAFTGAVRCWCAAPPSRRMIACTIRRWPAPPNTSWAACWPMWRR
jgi:hypothetical protein